MIYNSNISKYNMQGKKLNERVITLSLGVAA